MSKYVVKGKDVGKPIDSLKVMSIEEHDKEIRADERVKVIDKLIADIRDGNYCRLEKCSWYNQCGRHSCPIDGDAEELFIAWLDELKE